MTKYATNQKPQSHTPFKDREKELGEINDSCYAPESQAVIGGLYMGKTAILREIESLLWKKFREGRRSKKDLRLVPIYVNIDYTTAQRGSVNILFGKILKEARRTVNKHLKSSKIQEELDRFQPSVDDPEVSTFSNVKLVVKLFERELEVFWRCMERALNCNIRLVFLLDNAQNLTEDVRHDFVEFLVDLVRIDSTDTKSLRSSNVFIITCDDEVDKLFPSPRQVLKRMKTTKLYAFSGHVARHEFVVPLLENRFGEVAQENKEPIDQIALEICEWAGGHPKLLEHCVNQAPLEDIDIDVSCIQQLELDEHVQELLNSCIQSCDLRVRILEILAEAKEPVPKAKIFEKIPATSREVWRHLEALRYHGLVQAHDKSYFILAGIFRDWFPWEPSVRLAAEDKEERIQHLKERHKTLKDRSRIVERELDKQPGNVDLIQEMGELRKKLKDIETQLKDLGVNGIGV